MTSTVLDSPPQLPAAGAWGSLYGVQEPLKCQRVPVVPAASKKKPAYGIKRNLEMCTEALGCETGGVDTAADDVHVGMARKRHAWDREQEEEETKAEPMVRRVRVLPPPLTTPAAGAPRVRMVHARRDGRLEVYAVRSSGVEAERSGGRLRLRFLPCAACKCNAAKCSQQESQEGEEHEADQRQQPEDAHVVAKYARGGRCVEEEGGATAARRGGKWEPEQAATFWVAIT
ncbi:hypothetical protein CFC21_007279 [Triticum aestivum]|uniref:FAF domain-containing protein n=3 Tax=Triticum TaxID=4564 RepID=A0A9R0QW57_TRITD|nr:hypothetical protein CFC21_007279 [Triticum aestivum]VAH18801.1 unnamed protein product [Triticum turgidum subsp. durum]